MGRSGQRTHTNRESGWQHSGIPPRQGGADCNCTAVINVCGALGRRVRTVQM